MSEKFTCFKNVRISIPGGDAKEAYAKLCSALTSIPGVEWETDTFENENGEEQSTEVLWGDINI